MTQDTGATSQSDKTWHLFLGAGLAHPQSVDELVKSNARKIVVKKLESKAVSIALAKGENCAIVWQRPQTALALALSSGESHATALLRWQDMAQDVLGLYRKHRRHLLLIAEDALTHADETCRSALDLRLGWKRPAHAQSFGAEDEAITLFAHMAIAHMPELQPLTATLEASSIAPVSDVAPSAWIDKTATALRAQQDLLNASKPLAQTVADLQDRLTGNEAETARLRTQLSQEQSSQRKTHEEAVATAQKVASLQADLTAQEMAQTRLQMQLKQAQEALQKAHDETASAAQEAEALRQELTTTLTERDKLQRHLSDHTAETTLLRDQLSQEQNLHHKLRQDATMATQEAEALRAQLKTQDQKVADLQRQIAQTQEECALLHTHLALQQEDALRCDTSAHEQATQQAKEAADLQSELLSVDTALTKAVAEAQQAEDAKQRAEAELSDLRATCDRLQHELAQLTLAQQQMAQEAAQLRDMTSAQAAELTALRQLEAAIYASTSWRTTAPLRRLSRLLGRHRNE